MSITHMLMRTAAAGVLSVAGVALGAEEVIEQLRERSIVLHSQDEIDAIIDAIPDDVRLVLLGEATHGTHEFYTWRAAISQRLIEDRGFSFIGVEGDWADCARIDRYVRRRDGAAGSAREALLAFDRWPRWLWANEEIVELAEWMRRFNDGITTDTAAKPEANGTAQPEPVGFFGVDVYGLAGSIEQTPRFLRKIDPNLAGEAEEAYACLAPHAENPRGYLEQIVRTGRSCEDDVRRVVRMIRDLQAAGDEDGDDEDRRRVLFHAKHNALVVQNAERHFRKNLSPQREAAWNARAEHFYLTAERLLAKFGSESRGIVWAHNTHIGDARAVGMGQAGMVTIGQLARQGLGEDRVYLIGFATYQGEAIAGRAWDAPHQSLPLPPARPDSIEHALNGVVRAAAGPPNGALLLRMDEMRDGDALRRPWPHRAIGVVYQPEQERQANYVPSLLLQRYDALIFIPETRALTPLHEEE